MHKELIPFSISITEENLDEVTELLEKIHNETQTYISELAEEKQITFGQAADVYYLRTRSRWTQELENQLIQLFKEGKEININEWPDSCSSE